VPESLANKVAVVTGGGSGIGAAIVEKLPKDSRSPETTEEREAIARAKADLAVGRVTSLAEVKRELGL
jgi:NAD(P)-dependent dehydrogenase (short-subunit alcohol dehydrogenase family)